MSQTIGQFPFWIRAGPVTVAFCYLQAAKRQLNPMVPALGIKSDGLNLLIGNGGALTGTIDNRVAMTAPVIPRIPIVHRAVVVAGCLGSIVAAERLPGRALGPL